MDSHVEDSKVELSQVEQGGIDMLRLDEVLNQIVWNLSCGIWFLSSMFLPRLVVLW